jgi:ribosomal protein L25 (general stress protein Ctc)
VPDQRQQDDRRAAADRVREHGNVMANVYRGYDEEVGNAWRNA